MFERFPKLQSSCRIQVWGKFPYLTWLKVAAHCLPPACHISQPSSQHDFISLASFDLILGQSPLYKTKNMDSSKNLHQQFYTVDCCIVWQRFCPWTISLSHFGALTFLPVAYLSWCLISSQRRSQASRWGNPCLNSALVFLILLSVLHIWSLAIFQDHIISMISYVLENKSQPNMSHQKLLILERVSYMSRNSSLPSRCSQSFAKKVRIQVLKWQLLSHSW